VHIFSVEPDPGQKIFEYGALYISEDPSARSITMRCSWTFRGNA
jgi:hypothetical protein